MSSCKSTQCQLQKESNINLKRSMEFWNWLVLFLITVKSTLKFVERWKKIQHIETTMDAFSSTFNIHVSFFWTISVHFTQIYRKALISNTFYYFSYMIRNFFSPILNVIHKLAHDYLLDKVNVFRMFCFLI